jgi:hypothetical protein
MMDTSTAYFTLLSTILAIKVLLLLPLCLFVLVLPAPEIEVEFPPPPGYSGTERRTVKVPTYPSFSSLLFLSIVYTVDIILVYPFTRHGNECQPSPLQMTLMIGGLGIQTMAAVGWSGISSSWLSAEKKYGLWHSWAWGCYYLSFILVGVTIGLPLFYMALWHVGEYMTLIAPTVWDAFYHAFAPIYSFIEVLGGGEWTMERFKHIVR